MYIPVLFCKCVLCITSQAPIESRLSPLIELSNQQFINSKTKELKQNMICKQFFKFRL
jgi:hypothetical protein